MSESRVVRALLSVSDKTGLVDLATRLSALGVELLSTGGTKKSLEAAGLKVVAVDSFTGSPEVMDGRVKTLHPRVHGGILHRGEVDRADLEKIGSATIDLVVVNLYPFEATLAKVDSTLAELIENIDIGGPSMIRSAAKNHDRVTVVCDPGDYAAVIAELTETGSTTLATRRRLAAKAFARTAAYDGAIAGLLSSIEPDAPTVAPPTKTTFPKHLNLAFELAEELRYGENPHQAGAFYRERSASSALSFAERRGSLAKELSFNNLVDLDAAWEAVGEFDEPAAVVVKHTNPCGVAVGETLEEAYRSARAADETSAFGGIVAVNRDVDEATGRALAETFLECIVAPSFSTAAEALLGAKKNLRLLAVGSARRGQTGFASKQIGGGVLLQARDPEAAGEVETATVASDRAPSDEERRALALAWKVAKHVKSNAIVLAVKNATVGIGAGQMSRVESVRIACSKAGEKARGAVLASDGFFPFADGVELAMQEGVTAFAQPGGSVKDSEVIRAINAGGAAMLMTGVRHFRH